MVTVVAGCRLVYILYIVARSVVFIFVFMGFDVLCYFVLRRSKLSLVFCVVVVVIVMSSVILHSSAWVFGLK